MTTSPSTFHRLSAVLIFFLLPFTTFSRSSPITSYPNISFSYTSFPNPKDPNFTLLNSTIIDNALQLTPDSSNSDPSFFINKSGRVLYYKPFKVYENIPTANAATYVASFWTSFQINVNWINGTPAPGEGLAFLIAPDNDGPPPNSFGQYLGLTNATLNGNASNHFIAVEFDTVQQQPYDPNDNHVGLDINSVVSNVTANLNSFGIEISAPTPVYHTVWIDYSGKHRSISIYMANSTDKDAPTPAKPDTPVLNASLDLSAYLKQQSYFGFAASTGLNYELNCVRRWNLTYEALPSDKKGWWSAKKYAFVIVPIVLILVILFICVGWYMKRRRVGDDPFMLEMRLKNLPGMPREFTFKELKRATGNFNEKRKLGQGGFGVVYRGVIPGENTDVAVKKFMREKVSSQNDFFKELTIINRLRHKHLVPLLGWCHKNNVLLLVYEYMPNGSLDQHIFGNDRPLLRWDRRYNIIVGLASALHYLHDEYDQKVVHRDLKASNVMVDTSFNARLGDFGLARAIETDKTAYTDEEPGGVPGTLGYIAPECILTGKATRQSDVYGFGAVMLEVACGRRPRCDIEGFQFLADWVWKLHREGRILEAIDERLEGEFVDKEAERLLLLGLACSHPIPGDRPKMTEIMQMLSGAVSVPEVPVFKPKFVWSSEPVEEEESPRGTSRLISIGVNSSYYGSSGVWTPQYLSEDDVRTG